MDYKLTLNLPKTKFPMQANLQEKEITILNYWNTIKKKQTIFFKKKFILNDGPPYANGDIHMGHAFNKILKDIISKFKKLNGYDINFIPGWDCHGLPIELNVEKKIKNIKDITSDNEFRQICRSYATSQIVLQKNSFIRLGIDADWNNAYNTMSNKFEEKIINNFKKMFENKHIYLGYKPIYWCFECSSALAEAEIEYYLKKSFSIYVLFKFETHSFKNKNKNKNLIIWTTTPWTLPFNEGIALNKNFLYILFEYKNEEYILNKDIFYIIKKKSKIEQLKIKHIFKTKYITKNTLFHPFYKKKIKIILSDHVKNDSGTGCVHIAPAYGNDDYKIALKNNMYIKNKINEIGFLDDTVKFFNNENFLSINKKIILLLKKSKNLFLKEIINHKYPYCWRHKTILIFRTTQQWFFNINNKKLKNRITKLSNKLITWIPKNGSIKIKNMIKNRLDWCISRQRIWGVPIILLIDKNNKIHPKTIDILEKAITITKKLHSDFWYKEDIFKLLNIDKKKYKQIIDVLDVWFDSSAVYDYISKTENIKLPINLCIEGSDQYRGWFQVSIINSISNYNSIPYKNILTHGFILDSEGKKMSKSLNNIISPHYIIKKYGAEIFRLWTSSVNYAFDINFSEETIKRVCDAYRKIRNTFRFMLSNTENLNINKYKTDFLKLDIWILYKLLSLKEEIKKENKKFKFYNIYKKIYNFCINELCSKYFEIIKDKLYTINSNSQKASQYTMYIISYNLVKLIFPILSFTAEEIWQNLIITDKKSISLSHFKINIKAIKNIKFHIENIIYIEKAFQIKDKLNKQIEKYKNIKNINTNLELNINLSCNIYLYNIIKNLHNEAKIFFIISKIRLKKIKHKQTDLNIKISKSNLKKCDRCWNRYVKIFAKLKICKKCIKNLYYENPINIFI
ncbi:MAG TPA: isoleucine--tRNA ligase [Candidatus Azoamicus sp.]